MNKSFDLSVYFVVDPSLCGPLGLVRVVAAAVHGGATIIQLRDKSGDLDLVARRARDLMDVLRPGPVPLLINDYVDVAADVGADGVHLGQGDCDPALAREILGMDAIVGLTAFTPEHLAAVDSVVVDYVGSGPVYETKTDKGKPVIGPEGLAELVKISPVPVVGIGGITPETAEPVMQAGAHGVAMMRAISEAAHPDIAAHDFAQITRKYKLKREAA